MFHLFRNALSTQRPNTYRAGLINISCEDRHVNVCKALSKGDTALCKPSLSIINQLRCPLNRLRLSTNWQVLQNWTVCPSLCNLTRLVTCSELSTANHVLCHINSSGKDQGLQSTDILICYIHTKIPLGISSVEVKALCYKLEGCEFETRWGNELFSIYLILLAALGPGIGLTLPYSNRNE
jgi:hypothetical protein